MSPPLAEMPRLRLLPRTGLRRSAKPTATHRSSWISPRPASGDRRIALALHAAQGAAISVPGLAWTPDEPLAQPRTIAEIVEMAEQRGWSQVFKALKSNGLLLEQTLGHVVAQWLPPAGHAEILP